METMMSVSTMATMSSGRATSCFVFLTVTGSFGSFNILTLVRTLLAMCHASATNVNSCPNVTKIFPGHPKETIFSKFRTEKLSDIWMLFPDWMIVTPLAIELMRCPWIAQLQKLEILHNPELQQ